MTEGGKEGREEGQKSGRKKRGYVFAMWQSKQEWVFEQRIVTAGIYYDMGQLI